MTIRKRAIGLSIGPAHIAAARTAVSLTGALTRAIGAATAEVVVGAKPTFEQIFAGQTDPTTVDVQPPTFVEQLTDRIKKLLSDAGIELSAPVSFAVAGTGEGVLIVEGKHPQRELIETAIAHDTSIEHLVAQWDAANNPSQEREPLGLTIGPQYDQPGGF